MSFQGCRIGISNSSRLWFDRCGASRQACPLGQIVITTFRNSRRSGDCRWRMAKFGGVRLFSAFGPNGSALLNGADWRRRTSCPTMRQHGTRTAQPKGRELGRESYGRRWRTAAPTQWCLSRRVLVRGDPREQPHEEMAGRDNLRAYTSAECRHLPLAVAVRFRQRISQPSGSVAPNGACDLPRAALAPGCRRAGGVLRIPAAAPQ